MGVRLSYKLAMPVIDTDKEIEREEKKSITEIFSDQGEEAFRKMETRCLVQLKKSKAKKIISVGGGLPLRTENQKLLRQLGKIVYLRTTPETVFERVRYDKDRPLLQCDDPKEKITQMIKDRTPVYESIANIIIDTDGKTFEQITSEIQEALR